MSSEIEHGPKPKASPQIQSANNHLDASLTEDDRREVQSSYVDFDSLLVDLVPQLNVERGTLVSRILLF